MLHLLIAVFLLFFGCQKDLDSTKSLPVFSALKASAIFAPMLDCSLHKLSWDLSQELTTDIQQRLIQKNRIHVVENPTSSTSLKKFLKEQNPFQSDLSIIKSYFPHEEFIVFTEIFEHQQQSLHLDPNLSSEECPAQLNIGVRIKILDLRNMEPKVIFQQNINHCAHVPKEIKKNLVNQAAWQEDGYRTTLLGLVHRELIQEIADRIEDYILLAKQNK